MRKGTVPAVEHDIVDCSSFRFKNQTEPPAGRRGFCLSSTVLPYLNYGTYLSFCIFL